MEEKKVFRGKFEFTLDGKGRVSIPSKFRDILQQRYDERLMITNNDGCIVCYPMEEWEQLESKILSLPQSKPEVKAFMRSFFASVTECQVDRQGRILIPLSQRSYAGLDKQVILIGMLNKIEIWGKEKFEQEIEGTQENQKAIDEVLAEYGL